MEKIKTKKTVITVGSIALIVVLAVLAIIFAPTIGDFFAMQSAQGAHAEYAKSHPSDVTEYTLYKTDGKFIALQNGSAVGIFESRPLAIKAVLDDPATASVDESLPYTSFALDGSTELFGVEKRRAVICFTFDDGNPDDDNVYSLFKTRNIVCSFALPTTVSSRFNKYLSYQSEGFEILSHSTDYRAMNTNMTSVDLIETKFETSKSVLETAGFDIKAWVTPSSQLHEDYLPALRNHYDLGFTTALGSWNEDSANATMLPYNTLSDDVHKLWRVSLESTSVDRIKTAIDQAIENVGYLNFYAHGFDKAETGISSASLNAVLDYVQAYVSAGDCIITTVTSGADYFYQIG